MPVGHLTVEMGDEVIDVTQIDDVVQRLIGAVMLLTGVASFALFRF